MWSARSHAKREKKSFTTARPARPFAARLMNHSSPSSALRSSSHSPQLAQPGHSKLVSFTTARPVQPFAARSQAARPAWLFAAHLINHSWPFEARLIHHSSPSPALRSSCYPPQLVQLGPSQLVSFTTVHPARSFAARLFNHSWPFAARLIHYSSPSPALRSSCYPPQLAQLGPSQLVSLTTARPARPFAARLIHHSSPSPALRSSSRSLQLAQLGPSQLVQGVSQITLQAQNAISPEMMLVFPQKFHCITGRSYLTTYLTANQSGRREPAQRKQTFCEVSDGGTHDCFWDLPPFTNQIFLCGLDQASFSSTDHIV